MCAKWVPKLWMLSKKVKNFDKTKWAISEWAKSEWAKSEFPQITVSSMELFLSTNRNFRTCPNVIGKLKLTVIMFMFQKVQQRTAAGSRFYISRSHHNGQVHEDWFNSSARASPFLQTQFRKTFFFAEDLSQDPYEDCIAGIPDGFVSNWILCLGFLQTLGLCVFIRSRSSKLMPEEKKIAIYQLHSLNRNTILPRPVYQLPACVALRTLAICEPILSD